MGGVPAGALPRDFLVKDGRYWPFTLTMHLERRTDRRVRVSLPTVLIRKGGREKVEMLEASYRGLVLRLVEARPVRELVKLHIDLPSGELITHAVVVRILGDPRLCGMRLFALNGKEQSDWEQFVHSIAFGQKRVA